MLCAPGLDHVSLLRGQALLEAGPLRPQAGTPAPARWAGEGVGALRLPHGAPLCSQRAFHPLQCPQPGAMGTAATVTTERFPLLTILWELRLDRRGAPRGLQAATPRSSSPVGQHTVHRARDVKYSVEEYECAHLSLCFLCVNPHSRVFLFL